jgi:hypothetical protein
MKKVATLLICFAITSLYGQKASTIVFNKYQIGANFSSDICYRTLANNNGESIIDDIIDWRNGYEIPKFGYTSGFTFVYNLNKNVGFEAGFQISNKGYQTETKDLIYGDQIDPITGDISNESSDLNAPTKAKQIYSDFYYEFPMKANFTIGRKKIRFIASVGVSVNRFITEKETSVYTYINGSTKRTNNIVHVSYNRTNISPMISAGIDWKVTPKMNLKAEPTFRYGVLKIIDQPITGYLWNCGMNLCFYYSL